MRNVEGAKAGSNQKKPYRAPVSVTSTQRMRIKYGISEGTIRGFSAEFSRNEMLKRIYLDGTPIMSAEGEQLLDVVVEFRDGSRDQEPINGLPSISVEHDVGVEVKLAAPVSRSFDRSDTTSYDVRISVPTLYQGDDEGNSKKGLIQFKIDVSTDGGAFEEAGRFDIYEKILNGFAETYNVVVPKGSNHVVRISRLNSEVVSDYSVNRLVVEAITENTDVRLRYTNTAVLYLEYDAEQFSNVPKLEMRVFGKNDILVPANYNGDTHTYATSGAGTTNGVWDGTWKRAYTDNPVWISLDLMISRRYGLGDKIDLTFINKWELYGLAQYCDEAVADGKGGFEPRFTCNNMYLQKSEDAYRVLKDLAASFRAKVVWDGEFITLQADVPRDPVHTFSNANASDITYSSTQDSAQRNLINVQYYDRDNKFASDVVMQRSNSNILSRGKVVDGNFTALGCASQGQAQRIASYVMNTELYETELVSFTTGLEGGLVRLNDVIQMADNSVAGQTVGGRIAAVNGRSITLDRKIPDNVRAIATTQLSINRQDVKNEPISIVSISDDRMTAVLASDAPAGTEAGLVWALLTQDLVPQKFVVTDIEFDSTNMTFALSAIQYNESKYAAIDGSARIVVPPISVTEYKMLKAPIIVIASYLTRIIQDAVVCDIDVSWAQSNNAVQYQLEMQKAGSDWRIVGRFMSLATTLENMYTGTYTFRVCAYDSLGNASQYTYSDPILVAGKVLPPPALAQYSVVGILFGYQHKWIYPAHTEDSRAVRLRFTTIDPVASPSQDWQYIDVAYPTANFTEQDVSAGLRTWFSAAIVDKYGNVGAYTAWQSAVPSVDATQVLDLLDGQLTAQQLDQDLINTIAIGAEAALAAESAQNAADAAAQAATNAQTAANGASVAASNAATAVAKEVTDRVAAVTAETNARTAAISKEAADRAAALTTLDNKVTAIDGRVTSNSSSITSLNNSLTTTNTNVTAAQTAATNAMTAAGQKGKVIFGTTAPVAADQLSQNLWIDTTGNANTPKRWNGTAWAVVTDKVATDALAAANAASSLAATKADSSALTALDSKVTTIDGKVTTNASNITTLQGKVTTVENGLATKANVSALNDIYTKTQADAKATEIAAGEVAKYDASLEIGGANLLKNSEGVFTPNTSKIDNHVTYQTSTVDMINGKEYTLSGETNGEWSNIHNGNIESNKVTLWLVATGINTVISNSDVGTKGRTFVWDKPSGTYVLRLNSYKADNSIWFKNIKIESGNKRTDWSPSPSDVKSGIDANASAITTTNAEVARVDGRVTTESNRITMLTGRVDTVEGAVATKADASALNSLTTRVATEEGKSTSQGNAITTLQNTVNHATTGLATKASTSALDTLDSKVTGIDGRVTANATNITSLQAGLTTANNNIATKADGTALSALTTRVSNAEGNLQTQSNQITSLTASLNNLKVGGTNLLAKAKMTNGYVDAGTGADGTNTSHLRFKTAEPLSSKRTVVFSCSRSGLAFKVYPFVGTSYKGSIILTPDVPYTFNTDVTTFKVEISGAAGDVENLTNYKMQLEYGTIPTDWSPAPEDIATTAALASLDSKVTSIDGKVTTNSTSITNLSGKVTAVENGLVTKADGSALTALTTRVAQAEGNISTQSSQVTNLTAALNNLRVGGINLIKGSAQLNATEKYMGTGVMTGSIASTASNAYTDFYGAAIGSSESPVNETQYTLSFYAKAGADGTQLTSYFYAPNTTTKAVSSQGRVTTAVDGGMQFTLTTTWVKYSVTWTQTAANSAKSLIIGRLHRTASGTISVQIAAAKLEVGNVATDWSPAPSDTASAAALSTLDTKVTSIDGRVTANATQLSSLSTTVGNHTASISSQQTSINGLSAKATIQVAAGNTVGGVSLGNNGGVVDFIVRANTFAIAPPVSANAGNAGKYAFNYRATPVTLPNGTVSPAGLYLGRASIDYVDATQIYVESLSAISAELGTIKVGSANIADLAVTTAKIGDLQVDTLKIKNNAVTVPVYSYTSGIAYIDSSAWITSQSIWAPCSNGVTLFFFNFSYDCRRQDTRYAVKCRILKNGVIVRPEFTIFYFEADANSINVKSRPAGTLALNYVDGTGVDGTFELQFYISAGNGWNVDNRYTSSLTVRK